MNIYIRFIISFLLIEGLSGIYGMGAAMDDGAMSDKSFEIMSTVEYSDFKIEGEIGRRIDLTINNNLLALDVDEDFIKPFRKKRSEGSWEYTALGKLIDSTVRFAAYSGDARVIALKDHLVDSAIACQEPDGYIGVFAPGKRLANLWDIHEMAYLILGMLSDYQCFANDKSLQSAIKMSDYMIDNWSNAHLWTQAKVGLDYAMIQMYKETGDRKYLDFCLNERKLAEWNKPIKLVQPSTSDEDGDGIDGHHSYAYMDECIAQLELYRINHSGPLIDNSNNVMGFLASENGLFVTGSCSRDEDWTNDQNTRGNCEETCATAYLLRFLENKMRLEGDSLYGDIMERAIYNALFAAQAADGRKLRYFTAIEGPREYFNMDTSCCPGNFRRIIADLPSMIYYQYSNGFAINLYAQSCATLKLANGRSVRVSQETDYPNSGNIVINIEPRESSEFPLRLRIPGWCKSAELTVNGSPVKGMLEPGTFFDIDRKWNPGDRIELNMPMEIRLIKGRVLNTMKVAVMRGPVLFCLNPSLNMKFQSMDNDNLIGLNPDTFSGPTTDQAIRPDGMAIDVSMWVKDTQLGATSIVLHLTEFPDPDGQVTFLPMQGLYFKGKYYGDENVKNMNMMADDELYIP